MQKVIEQARRRISRAKADAAKQAQAARDKAEQERREATDRVVDAFVDAADQLFDQLLPSTDDKLAYDQVTADLLARLRHVTECLTRLGNGEELVPASRLHHGETEMRDLAEQLRQTEAARSLAERRADDAKSAQEAAERAQRTAQEQLEAAQTEARKVPNLERQIETLNGQLQAANEAMRDAERRASTAETAKRLSEARATDLRGDLEQFRRDWDDYETVDARAGELYPQYKAATSSTTGSNGTGGSGPQPPFGSNPPADSPSGGKVSGLRTRIGGAFSGLRSGQPD